MENFINSITTKLDAITFESALPYIQQFGLVALVIFAAWGISSFLTRNFHYSEDDDQTGIFRKIVSLLSPLVWPIIAYGLLHLLYYIQTTFLNFEPIFPYRTGKLILAWLFIRLVTLIAQKRAAASMVAMVIVPITVLHMLGLWDDFKSFLTEFGMKVGSVDVNAYKVAQGVLLITLLFWLIGRINSLIDTGLRRSKKLSASNRAIVTKMAQIGMYVVGFLVTLNVLGIDLTSLAVFSGAVGVGLGFGLQKITSNFISGLILLFEKSIRQGDMVEMSDGTLGTIRHISARYTLVETFSGKEIMVPNEDFITQQVVNWTYSNAGGRIGMTVGVSYDADIKKARDLILEAIKEHPDTSKDDEPAVHLTEFGDSSVNFQVFFWVEDIIKGRYRPKSDVLFAIWDKFHEHDIEIPFPQRDLHVKGPIRIERYLTDEEAEEAQKKAKDKAKKEKDSSKKAEKKTATKKKTTSKKTTKKDS